MAERISEHPARPWTVYILVVLALGSTAFGLIADAERNLWDVIAVAVTVLLTWGMWVGRAWAFSISFMLMSLCAGLALVAALAQAFLLEGDFNAQLLLVFAVTAGWLVLLLLPETKRFAGLQRGTSSSQESGER